jgi:uracil-DNA glycosylase family 4
MPLGWSNSPANSLTAPSTFDHDKTMGLEGITLNRAEAGELLQWWLESGVDTLVDDAPRQWLAAPSSAPVKAQPQVAVTGPAPIPADFAAFRTWLAETSDLPLSRPGARRILPQGATGAEVMLLADVPGAEDGDRPIGGASWELVVRMLAAIGFSPDQAYLASLSCMAAPGARLSAEDMKRCAELARQHVALAAPKRLILFGDGPSRALLAAPVAATRGKIHKVEGVRTITSFAPSLLVKRPTNKSLAWRDLLLLMEER